MISSIFASSRQVSVENPNEDPGQHTEAGGRLTAQTNAPSSVGDGGEKPANVLEHGVSFGEEAPPEGGWGGWGGTGRCSRYAAFFTNSSGGLMEPGSFLALVTNSSTQGGQQNWYSFPPTIQV